MIAFWSNLINCQRRIGTPLFWILTSHNGRPAPTGRLIWLTFTRRPHNLLTKAMRIARTYSTTMEPKLRFDLRKQEWPSAKLSQSNNKKSRRRKELIPELKKQEALSLQWKQTYWKSMEWTRTTQNLMMKTSYRVAPPVRVWQDPYLKKLSMNQRSTQHNSATTELDLPQWLTELSERSGA